MTPFLFKMIASTIGELATDYIKSRKMKNNHKFKIEETKLEAEIERIKKASATDADWDIVQAQNSVTSWKDEFWTLVIAAPLIMCFIPGLAPYAYEGFERLEQVPEWYIIAVGVAIASAFGFRSIVSHMMNRKKP